MRQDYWGQRAKRYDRLRWANDSNYIGMILSSVAFDRWDSVLDVGTGTGIMARAVSPFVYIVFGLDNSKRMLRRAKRANSCKNIFYVEGDIRDVKTPDFSFNKIIARSVFHHLGNDAQEAMNECYRVLKPRGRIVLAQAVPPSDDVLYEYTEIMKLKDNRTVQTKDELKAMMRQAGFTNVNLSTFVYESFSLRNWLENNALSKDTQERIFELHKYSSDEFAEAFNLRVINGDCLINVRNAILVGEK